jgi:MoaA/NifB/PqqE/SkfB family radical SAM enzyme
MGVRWSVYKNAMGAFKGVNFRLHRWAASGMEPTFLIYQVTTACNSRCRMCGIWRTKPENELTLKEVEDMLSRPFFRRIRWVNLTGGEPFVRKDLVQMVKALQDRLPALELVAIPTNGFLTEKVVSTVKELLDLLGGRVLLNVNVSIDDIGEKHDFIRRTPGGYQKAMATLDELMKVQLAEANFETGTETVVMDHNIKDIRHIYSTLKEHTPHVNLTPAILSPYYNAEDAECGKLSPGTIDELVAFLEELRLKEPAYAYYNSKVRDILKARKLKKGLQDDVPRREGQCLSVPHAAGAQVLLRQCEGWFPGGAVARREGRRHPQAPQGPSLLHALHQQLRHPQQHQGGDAGHRHLDAQEQGCQESALPGS